MTKLKITVEDVKAELRDAATGPDSPSWRYTPAVRALLNSHDELLVALGKMKAELEETRSTLKNVTECWNDEYRRNKELGQLAETAAQALKVEREQSTYYEKLTWYFHGLAEAETERAEAAKQREEHLKSMFDVVTAKSEELEQRPIKIRVELPEAVGKERQDYLADVIEAIRDAGGVALYGCRFCERLLDLTHRPDGAHYCHNKAKESVE
ncbi:hypothetical protein [Serratia fonticola]|uniref:hypothetical protein n=1 Tax=Serratia fonticola TaxID=47917 RepID=UPI00217C94D7|nr:hypothetical protein [Serratia fonticola]CAI2003755.1 Uncharacterised protein [Serratia fonticola]